MSGDDRPMCECPKCGRMHWFLANKPPEVDPRVKVLEEALEDAIGEIKAGAPFTAQDVLLTALSRSRGGEK